MLDNNPGAFPGIEQGMGIETGCLVLGKILRVVYLANIMIKRTNPAKKRIGPYCPRSGLGQVGYL